MKFLKIIFILFIFQYQSLFAEYRSTADQIFSPDFMSLSQKIKQTRSSGTQEITLESQYPGNRLLTDKKRSVVQIQSVEELSDLPDPLINRIISVISKKKNTVIDQSDLNKYYVFANFVHSALYNPDENEFYIAIISKSARFKDVALQVEWFGEGAGAHNQIRFQFDQSITIIPQESDTYPILSIEEGDLIYSLQAIRAEGGEPDWNPLKGLLGEFANALQMFSTQSLAKLQIKNAYVESYSIKDLTSNQRKAIFEKALRTSNEMQENGIYNTVFNSCVTQALSALKVSLPKINEFHFNPYSVINMLGLATGGRYEEKKSMNKEFRHLIVGEVMTMEKIENTPLAKKIAPYLPIIQSQTFDLIIEKLALFAIDKKLSYRQFKSLLENLKNGKPIEQIASSEDGKKLVIEVEKIWQSQFKNQSFEQFFIALEGLKTQNP